jgi:hypothetical protein
MRCQEAAELLLEVEPAELAGEGDSRLAEHLRGCGRCAAVGARLLAGERVLGEALAGGGAWALGSAGTLAEVVAGARGERPGGRREIRGVEEALSEFEARAAEPVIDDGGVRWLNPRSRLVAAVAVPLAAAASLVLILVPWWGGIRPEPLPLPVMRLAERTPPAGVVVPAGRDAVLFRTSNPKITVVWIY